jgi:hemolysin III
MSRLQTAQEERWNVITHGAGLIIFIAATIYLFIQHNPTGLVFAGVAVYCLCQLFLYTASTSYHRARDGKTKYRLRTADHVSIYLSIAGTYTPVCLTVLEDGNGYAILIAVWAIALFGTIWKLYFTGKYEAFSNVLYLVMGWLVVIDLDGLQNSLSDQQLNLLIAGGFFFTVGVIFYAWQRLYFNHVIWHLFVLGGSISHLLMVDSML